MQRCSDGNRQGWRRVLRRGVAGGGRDGHPGSGMVGLAVLLGLAVLASGCERVSGSSSAGVSRSAGPVDVDALLDRVSSPSEVGTSGMLMLPGMDCLADMDTGIRAKVLVTEKGVRCQDDVPGGGLVGTSLKYFFPYYVFDVWPEDGRPEFFRIGATPRRQSIKGWVPATAVTRWDTRVGVRYIRRDDGRVPPLRIYADPEPLVELVTTGRTDAKPIARATLTGGRTLMPWPVAETRLVEVAGRVHELVRIDFLAELPLQEETEAVAALKQDEDGPSALVSTLALDDAAALAVADTYSDAEVRGFVRELKVLDLVFCVDNTRSTQPYLDSIRHAVENIARKLESLPVRPDVQVGLVLYRDYIDGLYFRDGGSSSVVQHFGLTSDLSSFLERIRRLREPDVDSDDYAEAGYDGLMAALRDTRWRGQKLSTRAVVLIGDNSFHEPDSSKNPHGIGLEQVRAMARGNGVQVFTLNIEGAGGNEEQKLHSMQFEAIAAAGDGECHPIRDAGQVVDEIRFISSRQAEQIHANVAVTVGLGAGRSLDVIAAEENLDIRQVTEVLQFLEGADIDVSKLRPGEPSFSTGWALVSVDGTDLLEREVYLAKVESEALVGALMTMCSRYFVASEQGGADTFGRNLFDLGTARRLGDPLGEYFDSDTAGPFDVFAMSKGIPINPDSVLRMTRNQILYMSEADKSAVRSRIQRVCIPQLVNAQNHDALWTFRDGFEFGWVPEGYLP